MIKKPGPDGFAAAAREQGSSLLLAMFVLVLLTGMGIGLLFLSQSETRMSQANLRAKRAFYLAESGLEDARATLFLTNGDGQFDDDLETAAGGPTLPIDFDPDSLVAVRDSNGNVTGFSGYNDDVPVTPLTALSSPNDPGWYIAFLTNDPIDGPTNTTDENDRVMITAFGAGRNESLETVQAIIEPYQFLPSVPSAAMTMLGPNPSFDNGNSNAQSHTGDDCGVSGGSYAPIVGTIGGAANAQVQADMNRPDKFESGPVPFTGPGTIGDLTDATDPIVSGGGHGTIDTNWLDCLNLKAMMLNLAKNADYYCNTDVSTCTLPSTNADGNDVVFIDGDLAGTPNGSFSGILAITGSLTYNGITSWDGVILAIGEGNVLRNGGGNGNPSGAVVVANIDPTPDGLNADKDDWCSSTPEFQPAVYDSSGAGSSTVVWCSGKIDTANSIRSYRVMEFLQR